MMEQQLQKTFIIFCVQDLYHFNYQQRDGDRKNAIAERFYAGSFF